MGCHFLLQCMKVKSESEVDQSCPTLSDPMDCSLPVSSIPGIFQARVLEWDTIAFSRPVFLHKRIRSWTGLNMQKVMTPKIQFPNWESNQCILRLSKFQFALGLLKHHLPSENISSLHICFCPIDHFAYNSTPCLLSNSDAIAGIHTRKMSCLAYHQSLYLSQWCLLLLLLLLLLIIIIHFVHSDGFKLILSEHLWLKTTEIYSLMVQEVRSPEPRGQQGSFIWRPWERIVPLFSLSFWWWPAVFDNFSLADKS